MFNTKKTILTSLTAVALLAGVGLFVAACSKSDTGIKIATEGAYPPFNSKNADGTISGFDIDVQEALCAEMKVKCTVVAQDWDGIIPGLVQKKYDAIMSGMSITDERKATIAFSDPYFDNSLITVGKVGAGKSLDDLKKPGVVIGAQRSTVASKWIEDNIGAKAKVNLYDTQTAAYDDLAAGRVQFVVADLATVIDWMKGKTGFELVGDKIDLNDHFGVGLRQEDTELLGKFNTALKTIKENGTYQKIYDKYFTAAM
ncbi:MAG: transporter substrate-binding domain-containing protein [Candidatus Pacebacteria bacterium]|nr:transporter substrate-binding domain-containing protein [Candidatus Paceibacterota bacterium]